MCTAVTNNNLLIVRKPLKMNAQGLSRRVLNANLQVLQHFDRGTLVYPNSFKTGEISCVFRVGRF